MPPATLARGLAASVLALLLASAPAAAQTTTYTWTGGDIDNFWFSANNWSAVGPASPPPLSNINDTVLVLSGTTRLTNTLDYSFAANSLTFDAAAGAFVVSGTAGEALTLGAGGITVAAGNANPQTFNA